MLWIRIRKDFVGSDLDTQLDTAPGLDLNLNKSIQK
jgi:hypothetical protein